MSLPLPTTPPRAALDHALLLAAALLAAVVPTLLALHRPPSATMLNQCAAVALWGGLAVVVAPGRLWLRQTGALLAATVLVLLAALASWRFGTLPMSLSFQAAGLLAGAAVMVATGASAARGPQRTAMFVALAWGLLASGVLSSGVALVQVFLPDWADGDWIAQAVLPGRASGNLRQPNHLCDLLLWALVAAVALHALGKLGRAWLWGLAVLLVVGVELSASRTGAAGLVLLLLWGLLDRRLPTSARWVLVATPLLYGLAYLGMGWWGDYSQQALGAGARVSAEVAAGGGSPNARPNVWRTTGLLILQHPWTGVGFGEFNFAWSLTAFENRPTAFFDHTHNLALQLMVELGLPLSAGVLLLMAAALVQAALVALRAQGDAATVARAALLLVLLCGLHSQVEYPLWYAYFLLPTALAWGLVLGTPLGTPVGIPSGRTGRLADETAAPPRSGATTAGLLAGVVMVAGGVLSLLDYQRVVEIYAPSDNSGPLAARIAQGQRSPFFAHQADYAAATNEVPPASAALGLMRATHSLLDTRLMVAWARQLALTGQVDAARWLAQRLREFHNPDSDEFFAPCDKPGGAAQFQCQAPQALHPWREFTTLPLLLPAAAAASQPAPASSARQ